MSPRHPIIVRFPSDTRVDELVDNAPKLGVAVQSLGQFYAEKQTPPLPVWFWDTPTVAQTQLRDRRPDPRASTAPKRGEVSRYR